MMQKVACAPLTKKSPVATRRFETNEEAVFMNYSTDDLLYGLIQHLATHNENEPNVNHRLYLTKTNYTKNRKLLQNMCGVTTQTLLNHLNKLIEKGLIEEFDLVVDDKCYPAYGIVVNELNNYKIIDNDWLFYLLSTRTHNAIRVYFYLLDKYEWKLRDEENFVFTNKDILKAIGYSASTRSASQMVTNILHSFRREGVIDYEEFYEETFVGNDSVPVPKMRLTKVARSEQQLH